MKDDLASGFKNVDRAADFAVFSNCKHIADPAPVVREMARVLRPEGVLVADAGVVGRDEARRWSDGCGLRAADVDGRFFNSYTGFLVRGTRAASVGSGV